MQESRVFVGFGQIASMRFLMASDSARVELQRASKMCTRHATQGVGPRDVEIER